MSQQPSAGVVKGRIATRTIDTAGVQPFTHCLRKRSLSWVKQLAGGVALTGLSLSLLASGKAEAISITFEKIVDTNTPIPGGTGNFEYFGGSLSFDNGNVAFDSYGDYDPDTYNFRQQGIYTSIDSKLDVIADTNTPIPGGTGNFENFYYSSLDNGNVAFSSYEKGVYTSIDSKLNVIADTNTPIPGGTGNFTFQLGSLPSLDNGNVAFDGYGDYDPDTYNFRQQGIYTSIDSKLDVIADTNTPIPGGTGNFENFYGSSLDNGIVGFSGTGGTYGEEDYYGGIYTSIDSKLDIIADTNTPIPGGTGNFDRLGSPSLDDGNAAFGGSSGNYFEQTGIYTSIDGKLNVIADTNTPIPGGTGNFNDFAQPLLDNGNVAFLGLWEFKTDGGFSQSGIYANIGGTLAEVIAKGDLLDGKRVSGVTLAEEGLSGKQLAFGAYFEDGSEGIYVATVPEPASVLGTLAFGTFGAGWLLKRRQRKQKLTSCGKPIE